MRAAARGALGGYEPILQRTGPGAPFRHLGCVELHSGLSRPSALRFDHLADYHHGQLKVESRRVTGARRVKQAKLAVSAAWEKCFADTAPFRSIP